MIDEKDNLILEMANDICATNNNKSKDFVEELYDKIDIKQYESIDTQTIIFVYHRKWTDILSSWITSAMRCTWWATRYDFLHAKDSFDSFLNGC